MSTPRPVSGSRAATGSYGWPNFRASTTALSQQSRRRGEGRKTAAPPSPLAGKLFDESGEPLYVQGAAKGQRRYRYYVSRSLVRGESEDAGQGWRISAPEIEQTVAAAVQRMLGDRAAIPLALEGSGLDPNRALAITTPITATISSHFPLPFVIRETELPEPQNVRFLQRDQRLIMVRK